MYFFNSIIYIIFVVCYYLDKRGECYVNIYKKGLP